MQHVTANHEDALRARFCPPDYSMLPAEQYEAQLWAKPFQGRLWTIRRQYAAGWSIIEVGTTEELAAKYLGIKATPQEKPVKGDVVTDEETIRSQLQIGGKYMSPDKDHPGSKIVKRWKDHSIVTTGTLAEIGARLSELRRTA